MINPISINWTTIHHQFVSFFIVISLIQCLYIEVVMCHHLSFSHQPHKPKNVYRFSKHSTKKNPAHTDGTPSTTMNAILMECPNESFIKTEPTIADECEKKILVNIKMSSKYQNVSWWIVLLLFIYVSYTFKNLVYYIWCGLIKSYCFLVSFTKEVYTIFPSNLV